MRQDKYQLAKEYEQKITQLRNELNKMDDVTVLELRAPSSDRPDYYPHIRRDLTEHPKLKALIRSFLETELSEYEEAFEKI